MFRFSVGLATTVVTVALLAAPIGDAAAQPDKRGAAAPRAAPAPAPRAAPAPAPRAAPAPMVRSAPAPQISRPAPSVARQAPVVRSAPQQRPALVRPQQSAPRIAAPRSTPSIQRQAIQRQAIQRQAIQRQAPSSRAATQVERRQQAVQQRQQSVQSRTIAPSAVTNNTQTQRLQQLESKRRLSRSERRELSQLRRNERQTAQQNQSGDQQKAALANTNQKRLQQLESKRRLSRSERRELSQLQRNERQNVQQNQSRDQQKAALANTNQKRLQQLESKRRLSRSESRELRQLRRDERQTAQQNLTADQPKTATTNNTQQRIQALQSKGRLTRSERRELRELQREERRIAGNQQQQQSRQTPVQSRQRTPRAEVTAQQVTQGRFASNVSAGQGRRAGRRAARLAARIAWQLGLLAPYVPWRGPVYWPYAYNDLFYYTFWPDAYDPGYWAYAYDDFFDGVFFPDGAPYVEYAAEGPYDGSYARSTGTTGTAPPRTYSGAGSAPGRVNQATREFCADQASGVTAWPLDKIIDAVRPTAEQRQLLDDLRKASQQAAAEFKDACPESVPLTPPGRLQTMTQRLQATSDAVATVTPALEAFYDSLTDEQKARFNEIGPSLAKRSQRTAAGAGQEQTAANCSSEKAGLSGIAVNRIEDIVQPSDAQGAGLDRLDSAMQKAVEILGNACPNTVPMTPVGRLEVMKQRLDAMIAAANAVRPALEDFYASLTDEQKAKFNRLGRQTAQSGG
jgi:hypothetical protein